MTHKFQIKMKLKILQVLLWLVIVVLGYNIVASVQEPIIFKETKEKRFRTTIKHLKKIRDLERAFFEIEGQYEPNPEKLIRFLDTAQFTITQQRDTTIQEFNKIYQITQDVKKTIIDTIGKVSVKDSLFKTGISNKLFNIHFSDKTQIFFNIDTTSIKNGDEQTFKLLEIKASKKDILKDQNPDLVKEELQVESVDEINGEYIKVGSLKKLHFLGNWPKSYESTL